MTITTRATNQATVFEAIVASLGKASEYNRNNETAPTVILWTDKERQWEPLSDRLCTALPQFLTLGPYDPAERTGPAIWLRCMIARSLPEASWPDGATPILYLPGVSRQELRAVEECPRLLQPLAALHYSGVFWTQVNAKDWTICAFMKSPHGGLGLEVARDSETQEAMRRALPKLADALVSELRGRRLQAEDFNELLAPDPVRSVLMWLNDPAGTRGRWDAREWETFRSVCKQDFDFDPAGDGEIVGAEMLGSGQGNWRKVWNRFAEAPKRYPNLPDRLRNAKPPENLFRNESSWPQDNDRLEAELREQIGSLAALSLPDAAKRITELETQHGKRRNWVWAELGQAPLAMALRHWATMAEVAQTGLSGTTAKARAAAYVADGWRADAASLDAVASTQTQADFLAVAAAVGSIYRPWLEAAALRFQELAKDMPRLCEDSERHAQSLEKAGQCVVFVIPPISGAQAREQHRRVDPKRAALLIENRRLRPSKGMLHKQPSRRDIALDSLFQHGVQNVAECARRDNFRQRLPELHQVSGRTTAYGRRVAGREPAGRGMAVGPLGNGVERFGVSHACPPPPEPSPASPAGSVQARPTIADTTRPDQGRM